MQKRIFISYTANDLTTAERVCTLLEAEGIECWIAPRNVPAGAIYAEEIINAIENTDALVLICSRYTSDSVHVRSEVEHAFSHKKIIFPVRMEDVDLGKALEYFLGSSHWLVAWDTPLGESIKRLAESMRTVLAGGRVTHEPNAVSPADESIGAEQAGDGSETGKRMVGLSAESRGKHPNNLPAQTTRLIGREKELQEVVQLLMRDDARLLTLTGPGGTGKTRLSLEVAAELLERFRSGVYFVRLAPISDIELVVPTIAQTLGIPATGSQSVIESIERYLKSKKYLRLPM